MPLHPHRHTRRTIPSGIRTAENRPPAESRTPIHRRRRASDHEPNRGWRAVASAALAVALIDWGTKFLVVRSAALESFHELWPGRVAIWHVRNDAMMLGLWESLPLGGRKLIAVLAALVALAVLSELIGRGHRLPPGRREWAWLFVGLAFGGMLGNLGERVVHWGVTDYLSLNWGGVWLPPGNVADLALFLSFPIALVVIAFELQARSLRGRGTPPPMPECNPAAAGG
jgi:lipoprotein signal peptidase